MNHNERQVSPEQAHAEQTLIRIASAFLARSLTRDTAGLQEAKTTMQQQHERAVVAVMGSELNPALGVIWSAEQTPVAQLVVGIHTRFEQEEYAEMLRSANMLYVLSEMNYHYTFAKTIFRQGVEAHVELAREFVNRFGETNEFLRKGGKLALADVDESLAVSDLYHALEVSRGIIHAVALEGTLGPGGRAYFDPKALINF